MGFLEIYFFCNLTSSFNKIHCIWITYLFIILLYKLQIQNLTFRKIKTPSPNNQEEETQVQKPIKLPTLPHLSQSCSLTENVDVYVISNEYDLADYLNSDKIGTHQRKEILDNSYLCTKPEEKITAKKQIFQLDKNNKMKCLIKNCSSNLKSTDTFNLFRDLEKIHPENTKIFLHLLRTKPKTMIFNKNKTQIVTDQKTKKRFLCLCHY